MKRTIRFAPIIVIAIVSSFFSCLDSEKNLYDPSFQTSNPMGEGFAAPEEFNWSSMQNVQITVEVNDKFNGAFNYKVDIYDVNPNISKDIAPRHSGVASKGEPFQSEFSIEKNITTIYIKESTPDGLSTVRAEDIPSNGVINFNFNSIVPSVRSLASMRGIVTIEDPKHDDTSLFPTECPANVTEAFDQNSFKEGISYKVTSSTTKINLGQKNNIKLYVTEDIALTTEIYLTSGSSLYILPDRKVTMPQSKNNGQNNSMISIGPRATLTIDNDIQIDSNFKLYNLGTINAKKIMCTNSSVFYNAGTAHIEDELSGQNGNSTIVNTGNIKTDKVYIQGDAHMINRDSGKVEIEEETVLNCNGGSWENDGEWITDDFKISAWNNYSYNRCKLIVKDKFEMREGHLIVDGGGYVECQELYMNNSKVELGAKALFKVTKEAEYGYQTTDKGFKGTGTEKALLIIQKAVAEMSHDANIIHYSGNLQILCSNHPEANLGWGKRWTLTSGAEWSEEGSNTVSIPPTTCNGGFNSGTTTPPQDPTFPIEIADTKDYAYVFEDQWPLYGDYDLNDVVMIVRKRKLFTNNKNKVQKFEFSIDICAVGAMKKIGAAIMLDGVKATDIKKAVIFDKNELPKNFNLNSQNIENGQEQAVIPLFDDAHIALGSNRYEPINTISKGQDNTNDYKTISFSIEFDNPTLSVDAFNINKLNVFIIANGNKEKRREVHVIGFRPTSLAETDIFGGNNDGSSLSDQRYYISKENLAWGIMVPTNFKWPLEFANIRDAYPEFESWVTSGGKEKDKWWDAFNAKKVFQTNKN